MYNPNQIAELVANLSVQEAGAVWQKVAPVGAKLTEEYARELLAVARRLSEWHKIMAVLMIGDFFFENEFVDYAVDMLTIPPTNHLSRDELRALLARGEDPFAVGLWACNLLMSRKTISPEQYRRISQLQDGAFGKQTLLEGLRSRVSDGDAAC